MVHAIVPSCFVKAVQLEHSIPRMLMYSYRRHVVSQQSNNYVVTFQLHACVVDKPQTLCRLHVGALSD